LNDYYTKWVEGYKEGPLLVINVDKTKFVENEEHLGEIIAKIDAELYGLF
jgi:deoxyadenosine/deoxycytidine kinase